MKYYIVDAFAEELFKGNPAAVCILDKSIGDKLMQKIAAENNLSETAFVKKNGQEYDLRWFTPAIEVDLCGHATLASAFVINNFIDKKAETFQFTTLSGKITVKKDDKLFNMNFPARIPKKIEILPAMEKAIGTYIQEAYSSTRDLLLRLESEEQIKKLKPDLKLITELQYFGVIATAKASNADFVSRFFAPKTGIPEDPVTGSSHCVLIPYWADKLHKDTLKAYQASERGGFLHCRNLHDRVIIGGNAVLYAEGEIKVN